MNVANRLLGRDYASPGANAAFATADNRHCRWRHVPPSRARCLLAIPTEHVALLPSRPFPSAIRPRRFFLASQRRCSIILLRPGGYRHLRGVRGQQRSPRWPSGRFVLPAGCTSASDLPAWPPGSLGLQELNHTPRLDGEVPCLPMWLPGGSAFRLRVDCPRARPPKIPRAASGQWGKPFLRGAQQGAAL